MFLDKPVNEFQDEFWEIAGWFRRRWITRIANMTGKKVDPAFGVDIRSVKTSAGIGTYVSKINYELARSDLKKGRGGGSRTPFQILEDAIDNDHPNDRRLWREYVHASKRRHTITTSPYLKKQYPSNELSDEEIASQEQDGETELLIDNEIWLHLMRHHRPAIISLIHAQQHQDAEATFRVVARHIGWCRLDRGGDIPHIKTTTKRKRI